MKSNYVTPTVTLYSYNEDIVRTSGVDETPETKTSFNKAWLE